MASISSNAAESDSEVASNSKKTFGEDTQSMDEFPIYSSKVGMKFMNK